MNIDVVQLTPSAVREGVTEPLMIFVDTNCFLQMRDFNQVDWKALLDGAKQIDVYVCEAVICELDVHKVSQSERRRKRARSALKTIEEASQTSDGLILKEANPCVRMRINMDRIDWEALDLPASEEPDDMLVAAAKQASSDAIVLSYDTGPRLKARKLELVAFEPPEDWLLKPEPSEASRRLSKIEREVQSLKNKSPELKLTIGGLRDGAVTLQASRCEPLGSQTIAVLTRSITSQNPLKHVRVTASPNFGLGTYGDVTQHDADRYERAYNKYRVQVENYFRRLHEKAFFATHLRVLDAEIANDGSVSARNLSVSVDVAEPLRLMARRKDGEAFGADLGLPEAPEVPRGGILDRMSHLHNFRDLAQKPDNPTRFRWANMPDRTGDTHGMRICPDFRPGLGTILPIHLMVLELNTEGRVFVEVSAEDQSTLSEDFIVKFVEGEADWREQHIREAMPEDVQLAFDSLGEDHDFTT